MTDKKLRFGILGCGMIAKFHADAITSLENAILFGAADNNPAIAQKYAAKYGIKAYGDYDQMLNDPQIDAVCICTPSGFHAENALKALKAGKNVVLEKPMALNTEDADKIIAACDETGKKLTVICQLRFSDDILQVKKLISENAFGKIVMCNLSMKYWRDEEYYASSPWKGTRKFDGGGALMNQGIHGIDLLLYIMGECEVLSAKTDTLYHNIEVEDIAVALLKFKNGALGTLKATTCAYPGFERRMEILGSNGCAVFVENRLDKLVVRGETIVDNGAVVSAVNTASKPDNMTANSHALQINNFINSILGEDTLLIDATEGKKALNLIETIYNM